MWPDPQPAPAFPEPGRRRFDPERSKADPVAVRGGADQFWDLAGCFMGRSGDLRELITGAAIEFTDLVSPEVLVSGQYDEAKWRETCMALSFSAGVADLWAEDIEDFERDRRELIGGFQSDLTRLKASAREHTEERVTALVTALVTAYDSRARDRMNGLLEKAERRARMLDDGPEPAHVKALVEAGVLGWTAYNILGAAANPPLPLTVAGAEQMAHDLGAYASGTKDTDARFDEIIAALAALTNKALALRASNDRTDGAIGGQCSGNHLNPEDLAFLKALFWKLDESGPGVLHLGEGMGGGDGPGLDPSVRAELSGALGNGLLVLSDEGLGGGQGQLPPSVQRFAEGEPSDRDHAHAVRIAGSGDAMNWLLDAEQIELLLGRARSGLRGGGEFSANVTANTGRHLAAIDPAHRILGNEFLSSLLEVTARNQVRDDSGLTADRESRKSESKAAAVRGLIRYGWQVDEAGRRFRRRDPHRRGQR